MGRVVADPAVSQEADHTEASLKKLFDDYMYETLRIKAKYPLSETKILVGFESEWIRPSTLDIIEGLLTQWKPFLDFFVGSVHHVHTFPIDFDDVTYKQARHKAGGNDIGLFLDYFDAQLDMLQALKPPVVGHFDLIRLKSDDPNTQFTSLGPVWHKIKRNLEFICSYGGCVELNSAALRKGLAEPYPCTSICQVSHTAHATDQVLPEECLAAFSYSTRHPYAAAVGLRRARSSLWAPC